MTHFRLEDRAITIGRGHRVRSFSLVHLQVSNPLRGFDRPALAAHMAPYLGADQGAPILQRAARWVAGEGSERPARLVHDLVAAGQGYGLAGQSNLAWILWQAAALILIEAGVDHPNELLVRGDGAGPAGDTAR
ncbi:hypothetical protein [Gimibacter soli]|uniref:Uncharacterized protein n=1 Tax=Gimibacter soli TaxID=3024400 RepID=A0AAE9XVF6_9PROT|nr:hypothetical protein [Gimibacter soli]WCL55610.1 hypothetical protein PH603_07525 [Gimibacter soli]